MGDSNGHRKTKTKTPKWFPRCLDGCGGSAASIGVLRTYVATRVEWVESVSQPRGRRM